MELLIPILISAGLGLISGAGSAFKTSRGGQIQAEGAQRHQERLLAMIDQMFATDTTSAPINAANRAIGGQFASSGLGGSGMNKQAAAEAAASIMAQEMGRKQGVQAQVLQNPVFGSPKPGDFNPWGDAFAGGLMGAMGGGAQAYGAQMSTDAGATAFNDAVSGWWQGRQGGGADRASAPRPDPMVPMASTLGTPANPVPAYVPSFSMTDPRPMKMPRR